MQQLAVAVVEHFRKVIAVAELLDIVFLGLAQDPVIDQIKNDVPEIFGGSDAPVIEDRDGHGAKAIEEKFPDAGEQFFTADVAGAAVFSLRVGHGLHDKQICPFPVARISIMDSFDYHFEMLSHNDFYINTPKNRKANIYTKFFSCIFSKPKKHELLFPETYA